LDDKPESWQPIIIAARRGNVTLLYSARDTAHNNAVALKEYLETKLSEGNCSGATHFPRLMSPHD
jgi:hypothetical protein